MAAITETNKYVVALGPIKLEIVNAASVDNGDTYVTTIQRPLFGCFVGNTSSGAMTSTPAVTFSGKTVTLASADLSASTGVLLIFGF